MAEKVKKILLGFVMIVVFLPLIQQCLPVITSAPLYGYFQLSPEISFTPETWIDGSYQEGKSKYLNDHVSFRPDFIRLNSQIDYSLFTKMNTGWGVIGKKGCILDMNYINSWNGADFVGYDSALAKLMKLKALQDTLGKLGKSLVLVHTATKPYFYADCIPGKYIRQKKQPTNFDVLRHIGDSLGIHQIDMNSWFCAMKDTSKELLYPKQGIHWSYYGAMLAGDSLVKYLEKLRHIQMPHPRWINVRHTTEPNATDNDIAGVMNLIWPVTTETFAYGEISCDSDTTKTKPSAVYIGDSYTITLIANNYFNCINSNWEFWFYFRQLHKMPNGLAEYPMENHDWQGALDIADCVILVYNAANLNKLGSGFIEAAYGHYFPKGR